MSETYSVKCECTNCDYSGKAEFAKGEAVPSVFECPNCGCETAKRVRKGSGHGPSLIGRV